MKKKSLAVMLLFVCFLCGCKGSEINVDKSEDTQSETLEKIAGSEIEELYAGEEGDTFSQKTDEDGIFFIGKNNNTNFRYGFGEYDYVFYLEGFYLSNDGLSDEIYIHPIDLVWNWETDRWAEWGHLEDEGQYYDIRDEKDETIMIPMLEKTEFHFYNDDDPVLYKICERSMGQECVTTDPEVFLFYIQTQFGDCAEKYPFFIIMDENGYAQYIIEYPFM